MKLPKSLTAAACLVLRTRCPTDKAALTAGVADAWRAGRISDVGTAAPPDRPARPDRPVLRPPRDVPRRRINTAPGGRIALLHALAHIELNAIDLAWDVIARFAGGNGPPRQFFDDWVGVAAEEAKHFTLLADRLAELGAAYGDLPAHDGLWEAAANTAHDLGARLAVVPLVLEARGLDVAPSMVQRLRSVGDTQSADILQIIHDDEIGHVAVGRRWFEACCRESEQDPVATFQSLVRRYFKGSLKAPFNIESRLQAGLTPAYYEPLAEDPASNRESGDAKASKRNPTRPHPR